jgi:DNA repair protein RadC
MATRTHTGTALQVQDSNGTYRTASDEEVLHAARSTINRRFRRGKALTSPADSREFLRIRLAHLEHEVFAVLWLDLCAADDYV